ncbi:MAG: thiamine ABC transporter substrate-binding protein [Bifidobacteriaceae bacterium]|jgi:thiamine transport system substrate-binding protein|nr:thiamine ABC transporter substrate-binding protein [Bifidobacteriaceae bacterium]
MRQQQSTSSGRWSGRVHTSRRARHFPAVTAAVAATAAALTLGLAGCGPASPSPAGPSGRDSGTSDQTVKLVTHGSFSLSEDVQAEFTKQTGLKLEVLPSDDAGAMVNQLILTKDAPLGDAVFGIDNTFASRAIVEGILEPYASPAAGPEQDEYAAGLEEQLTAIDFSDVCINVDLRQIPEGADLTFDDLLKPEFRDQLVVENPSTASPGLAFLLATIAAKGEDGYLDYWRQLKANGVKVVSGWNEAYYSEFSGPSSSGQRPLVVSYASSPPSEIPDDAAQPVTAAALNTCFRQVEYAGVLKGAANPEGARKLVDFLLSAAVQADIPGQMWVYPVKQDVSLPEDWAKWAPLADRPWTVPPEDITNARERWLAEFTDQILG